MLSGWSPILFKGLRSHVKVAGYQNVTCNGHPSTVMKVINPSLNVEYGLFPREKRDRHPVNMWTTQCDDPGKSHDTVRLSRKINGERNSGGLKMESQNKARMKAVAVVQYIRYKGEEGILL